LVSGLIKIKKLRPEYFFTIAFISSMCQDIEVSGTFVLIVSYIQFTHTHAHDRLATSKIDR